MLILVHMENQTIIDSLVQTIETQKREIEHLKATLNGTQNMCDCSSQDEHDNECLGLHC
jgi:hypothetical protein